jgi:hypothetical protein
MSRNTYRDESGTDQSVSYWRRRVITLAAGLSLLGLLAWAFSGGSGKPANPAPRSSPASGISPAAAYSGAPARSSGARGSGLAPANPTVPGLPVPSAGSAAGGTSAGAVGAASARPGSAAGGASAGAKSGTRAAALGQPPATRTAPGVTPQGSGQEPGGRCSPGTVVLSLFSSRSEYHGGQDPEFAVDAVSTASGACSFAVGPSELHLVVMLAGRIIWDSADCPRDDPGRVAELSRGVPAQVSVTWNRAITLPGCVTLASAARPGRYQVQARTATGDSPVRTIKLLRLIVADT